MSARACLAVFLSVISLGIRTLPAAVPDEPSKRLTQRIEYVKHIVKDAYEATAKKNRAWDERASAAIDNLVLNISSHPDADGDEPRIMYFKAGEALVAGCDDPMIHFCRAKLLTPGPERIEQVCKAADMMRESKQYGPYIRAYVMSFAAWWAQTNQQLVAEAKIEAHIPENIQAVMGLLPEIFADKELPPQLLIELMRNIGYVSMYVEGDRFALLNKANLALDKSPQGRALVLAIRGREMISYAWDGIGRGLAAAPANGPQLFDERIDKARKLLEESWQTWPNCEAATEMIAVLKAQQAPRQEVDQWFGRAMSLDSCNHWACLSMIEVLHPKWGGSEEEMLKFARDMAENGNWAGTIPDMVHHVHWQIAFMRPGAKGNYPDRNYFKAADVWKDLQPFYEEQIRRTPTQSWRTYYMLVAAWSEHWDVANEQLRKLRNNPHTRILREATRDMVKEIQAHAKTPTK